MEKGRIIFLNGVTSSGKTSIVEALQERETPFFYVVANDLFQEMVGEREELKSHYAQLKEILKDNPLEIVEVYCPLEECRRRNLARGDRYETQSEEQWTLLSKDISYRMRVNTQNLSPEECADRIIRELFPDVL